MYMQLQERVALVTGAGSGIGRAAALLLAREGARVAALGRSADELQQTVNAIKGAGGNALALEADISRPDQVEAALRKLVERWKRLDIVFANAGINGVWAPIEELTPEEWERTLSINLKGTFLTVKYAAPHLKRRGGSVIITSSVNGTRIFSNTGATAYSCSKAGQVGTCASR
jgi:NAD(P)-dependent dehydrogenase (short-subunit alcohol dehydrogenase family)